MVLDELLQWSESRPNWQRDALRRLVLGGELSDEDVRDLTEMCKATHGLADPIDSNPLTSAHVPSIAGAHPPVSLTSIFHHRGVNALAEGQTLTFAPHLTVVYGDNAAGKTGYIRILKTACRARGNEEILGNVTSTASPLSPVVAIKYRVDGEEETHEWTGEPDEFVSRVSVFDTQSANVYLTEKTNVAFRPFGLDLFDKLVQACKAIRTQLEKESRALAAQDIKGLQAQIPEGTAVGKLLSNITSLTTPEMVHSLCSSKESLERLEQLELSLVDLRAHDTEKLVRELGLRVDRTRALSTHLQRVAEILSIDNVDAAFEAQKELHRKSGEAASVRQTTFNDGTLQGTGSATWSLLWEAARRFSEEYAFPTEPFPASGDGARCVLCQQTLDHAARQRLIDFEAFVRSSTEEALQEIRDRFEAMRQAFVELDVQPKDIAQVTQELSIEDSGTGSAVAAWLAIAEDRRKAITLALREDRVLTDCAALGPPPLAEIDSKLTTLDQRVRTLRNAESTEADILSLQTEATELRARRTLTAHEKVVLDEIDRRRRVAAYALCITDTRTQAITRKSSTITRKYVTERLTHTFQGELHKLGFRDVEVDLAEAGGTEGVLFHRIVLSRAPGVELPKVVSEGEQRCLSIAAFLAELSTAEDQSGIVFDDPVSSLDYRWRDSVARRLVNEAKDRQVIVFTHDIVFLLALKSIAQELGVPQADQHIRKLSTGAGVCIEELPWVAQRVKNRIAYLRQELQGAAKLHRQGHLTAYERDASVIYGLLREAWERALEEVLLGGVVERFRPSVQTMQVNDIADVNAEDCSAVERAMTKCSKWLPGHDQAPGAPTEMPEPDELKSDIDMLASWVAEIRKRRH